MKKDSSPHGHMTSHFAQKIPSATSSAHIIAADKCDPVGKFYGICGIVRKILFWSIAWRPAGEWILAKYQYMALF
tara:strand:- start:62430 stop:62654 length:225 start_codon:yes stop_codon:yes gene_type:complete